MKLLDRRRARNAARARVLIAVNKWLLSRWRHTPHTPRLLTMRQHRRALSIAARHRLVDDEVLVAAGGGRI